MDKFGDRIRELRKAKGYSLRQLAPLVGVGFSYLSKVERGRLDFEGTASESLVHRLADVLETDEKSCCYLLITFHDPLPTKYLRIPRFSASWLGAPIAS